ncbi:hypothetical protein CLAIMM_14561 [Cladophialophora immunda]|nr:hypothetical protein CLAIMM_14561 [Cladophialophora immunda]
MAETSSARYNGACLCGNVTFDLLGHPYKVLQCYCLDCQKGAGGPCQIVLGYNATEVSVKDPESLINKYIIEKTQSGHVKEKHFCSRCGCTLWTVPMHHGGTKWMVRSSLVEDGLHHFKPDKEIFDDRRPGYIKASEL